MRITASRGTLKRAELAKLSRCHAETVRYYEKIGLMPDPPRSDSGHRIYGEAHLARLRFIVRARELSFTIEEIRGLLGLVDQGSQTCAEVRDRTEKHLVDIRARIADLRRIERVLRDTAARCSGERVPECPILETLGFEITAGDRQGRM